MSNEIVLLPTFVIAMVTQMGSTLEWYNDLCLKSHFHSELEWNLCPEFADLKDFDSVRSHQFFIISLFPMIRSQRDIENFNANTVQ